MASRRLSLGPIGLVLCGLWLFAPIGWGADANPKKKKSASKAGANSATMPQRTVRIAPVNANSKPAVIASAGKIDALVDANLKRHKIDPNPALSDELFIRRVYLDITGTVPNYRQMKGALPKAGDREWRTRLIDTLLNTDGYASHMYNYWADVLRLRDEDLLNRAASSEPYNEWVRKSMEENNPYDRWVHSMLAATGRYYDHPETGYLLRDGVMPLDAVNNTVRVFLGTQIGCAQCHDHPFDKWTRKQFYEVAAYSFGTVYKQNLRSTLGKKESASLMSELKEIDSKFQGNRYRPILDGNLLDVRDTKKSLSLPDDYQYDNGKPKQTVKPVVLFEPKITPREGESLRETFARWVTTPENPRFTRTIANRMWKRLFGVGQIEPVDDMKDDTVAENPELMTFLEQEMIRVKYDLKEFLRILLNTRAYQREASVVELGPGAEYHFPGPVLRRMTAEQVWDSFVTMAAFKDPTEYHREPAAVEVSVVNLDLKEAEAKTIVARMAEYRKEAANDSQRLKPYDYKGLKLVRASELPTPLPENHFLREFGQSDRREIEDSYVDGNVLQALQMLNGPITHMLLEANSMMYKNVVAEKKLEDQVDVVYLSILSRRATAEQRKLCLEEVRKHGPAGFGNVIWALVNTPEFLFVQ